MYIISNKFNILVVCFYSNMESQEAEKKQKRQKYLTKKYSAAYLRQREKANAKKRMFLDKMTVEQREIKRAKNRAYFKKKKAENKVKNITEMTEREKRKQRKAWKEASKKYREKKKALANIISNIPPLSDDDSAAIPPVKRQIGRNMVRKDRAKAYRKIKKQEETIVHMKRKIESLRKKLKRVKKKEPVPTTPDSKINSLLKDILVIY